MQVGLSLEWAVLAAVACLAACGSTELHPIEVDPNADAFDAGETTLDASLARDGGGPGSEAGADATSRGDAATAVGCKRGVASNAAPSAAFASSPTSPGIAWWYNWSASAQASAGAVSIEFDPMIWGSASLPASLPAGSKYVLGFNEPNFKAQADLTVAQAVAHWPAVEAAAQAAGAAGGIVAPGLNYCGSSSDTSQCTDPTVTDPYTYLKDFFAACSGCEVDYVAVHWYNCDLPSLQAYLEGNVDAGGGLSGFVQFGKPVWLTEFSCDSTHSVADQKAYMQAAVPYLESNPNVFRYSWFSAGGIPNAELANSDGSLTDLGSTYVALPQSCR